MKGEVLYLNDNENSDQKHPCFIISDPNEDNNVLIVNATTFHDTGREDDSCIICESECDIIKHTSYIDFAKAREVNCEWLLKKKFKKEIIVTEIISDALLEKIINGAKISNRLPKKFYPYLK